MRYTTHTFDGVKGEASYTCGCSGCGKVLNRKATVEHTINPFNKNDAGAMKTRAEVQSDAYAAAAVEAKRLAAEPAICRTCEEAPMKALLLEMAADPDRVFPTPEPYWNSPMHVLVDRKQVESAYAKCECGSACCSGWVRQNGYRITRDGIKRAKKIALEDGPKKAEAA